jgi:hypothetical protein
MAASSGPKFDEYPARLATIDKAPSPAGESYLITALLRGREGFIKSLIQHFVECWRPFRPRLFGRFFLHFGADFMVSR